MSRYLILVLINLPFVFLGVIGAITAYKTRAISRNKLIARLGFWFVVLVGLCSVKPIYNFLFSSNLTRTEPLSLFDVIQITGILFVLIVALRARAKADMLEEKLHVLHRQISLELSLKHKKHPKK